MSNKSGKEEINPNNLREIREREGLKKAQLARLADVSTRIITEIEEFRIASTPETKNKIVNGLNRNPEKTKEWRYEEVFSNS